MRMKAATSTTMAISLAMVVAMVAMSTMVPATEAKLFEWEEVAVDVHLNPSGDLHVTELHTLNFRYGKPS
jgi:hypothetical protein